MLSLAAGPAGVRLPGQVYDVPDAEARALLAAHAAEAAQENPLPLPARPAPQRATSRRGKVADEVSPRAES